MVSVSFGKSNFSEAQNSYQMTIALVMMVLVLCAISSITTLIITNKSEPTTTVVANKLPTTEQKPKPKPGSSGVKISKDGIQFPKPSTTEGYLAEGVSCKKFRILEESDFFTEEVKDDDGNIVEPSVPTRKNGFADYASYKTRRDEVNDHKWNETTGWCKKAGFIDENQWGMAYHYHDGDFSEKVWDSDNGRCTFTSEDKPYACIYKEIKDSDDNIIGVRSNEGKILEVEFYNDYKAGKLKPFLDNIKMGTKMKYLINDDGKLVFWKSGYNNGHEDVPAKKMVIKPGYNYPVAFMLLGTAITMVDNDIDMPANGIQISFKSLTEDKIRENMEKDIVDA